MTRRSGTCRAGDWDLATAPAASAVAQDPDVPAYQVTRALVASPGG